MALVSLRQPSALVSNGLSAATVALNIAGAATDAVPIAKQILNSAAHISAVAEKIQKKREAMYTLVEKADIYATQISSAVAGRILDSSLQRRLERLYSVFLQIEALVDAKVGSKNNALTRAWRDVVTKPNRAETLVVELEREIQLFQLLTGLQLSLLVGENARAVDDAARAVAADAKYDGQFRILRDCDIEKLDVIYRRETDEGVIVWASARVKRQLMVIRYLESQPKAESNAVTTFKSSSLQPWDVYLENIKKVSTVHGSHPHIVKLYGRHIQGPGAVFRAGTLPLHDHINNLRRKANEDNTAVMRLRLGYKLLDASAHLSAALGLRWGGEEATIDENGEPRIGLFDDLFPDQSLSELSWIYYNMFPWFNSWQREETGVVEQVHDSYLNTLITEYLRNGDDTDFLRRVWDTVRQELLHVACYKRMFPIISEDLSLSQELIARARLYLETNTKDDDPSRNCIYTFVRLVIAGRDANISSRMSISFLRSDVDNYAILVEVCTHNDSHIQGYLFCIYIPVGSPLLAELTRAAELPDNFEQFWSGRRVWIYQEIRDRSECDESSGLEEEDEEYSTADEGTDSLPVE